MKRHPAETDREPRRVRKDVDLVVIGGGLAGTCCAITAARQGLEVVLVQDRPVLGGNSSSEVRLWILGATSHMGNNNRWAREGGIVDEILVENMYRNPEGNPLIVDTILLEKVVEEPRITLLLNTAAFSVAKSDADRIESIEAFCSQNGTRYTLAAPLFCDASGDGTIAFQAGAAFRMGAEAKNEFDEGFAPDAEYGELLGHSMYFYSKDAGRPVEFVAPSFALDDVSGIQRCRPIKALDHGCQLWWMEYGGRLDTVHETEEIKWELWRVIYGVWNHIKNSGEYPEAANLTLEWVGHIPGKRESRRFEGDYILNQRDVIEQHRHDDAVGYGGWAVDLHPADGVFSELAACTQWHSKGVYQIPLRCYYSRNVDNLFLAGRIISASHVAFGSTRVMATCAQGAEAVGVAASLCRRNRIDPSELLTSDRIARLHCELGRLGHYVPGINVADDKDLAASASVTASSALQLEALPPADDWQALDRSIALLVAIEAGRVPRFRFTFDSPEAAALRCELRVCSRPGSFTPDETVADRSLDLSAGENDLWLDFEHEVEEAGYVFVCLIADRRQDAASKSIRVRLSDRRVTGLLTLHKKANPRVSAGGDQDPPEGIGIDAFEFWIPERRPGGKNPAVEIDPPIALYGADNLQSGPERPTLLPNAWVADPDDASPWVELRWDQPKRIRRVVVACDTDLDHPMESVLMGHPERVMPFCVQSMRVLDGDGTELAAVSDNHSTRRTFEFDAKTDALRLELRRPPSGIPAALFRVMVFGT